MIVLATELGFYNGSRRRAGAEFEMDEALLPTDAHGKPILPKWVVPASAEARAKFSESQVEAENKNRDAAIAASGDGASGGASRRKADEMAAKFVFTDPVPKSSGRRQ